jgi:nitroimidazol reductase NimA-like FMN-containing flavoprotein (pyridoxamine 5'-phosphate oxidase superfamily)
VNHEGRPTEIVRSLLDEQLLGVLGTHQAGAPYSSLVAFAATEDLRQIYFVTGRSTRKWSNLSRDARASMLIDNRGNRPEDFADAAAVTVLGTVVEVDTEARAAFLDVFLARHPYLRQFSSSPSCVLLCLEVRTYILVTRFQNVVELHLD